MPRIVSRNASVYLEDSAGTCRAFSARTNNITLSMSAEAPEVTAFGEDNRTRLSNGIKDFELSFDGFFDADANQVDAVLFGILGGSTLFKLGPSGSTSTCVMYSSSAVLTSYEVSLALEDAATVSFTCVNRSGSLTRTVWP